MENENTPTESEEDYGSYFLQPAHSPYNIVEKIQQANEALLNTNIETCKTLRVQFKDSLVTFESELTDDDINSIESDHIEIQTEENIIFNSFTTVTNEDPTEIFSDIEEVEEETVEEDIKEDIDDLTVENTNTTSTNTAHIILKDNDLFNKPTSEEASKQDIKKKTKKRTVQTKSREKLQNNIKCSSHCIDKIECDLSKRIQKLHIRNETPQCPPLKLHEKKCCTEKSASNLPNYNGLRSEYGLTYKQLEQRKALKKYHKIRRCYRRSYLNRIREQRTQENEEAFAKWLDDVSKRKELEEHKRKLNSYRTTYGIPQVCVYVETPECKCRKFVYLGSLSIRKCVPRKMSKK